MAKPTPIKLKSFPMTIALRSLKCVEETDEVGADEPYVLVTGVDLSKTVPQIEVTRYGPWTDTDKGETKTTIPLKGLPPQLIKSTKGIGLLRIPFWGLDNKTPTKISDVDKVAFVVSVMEHDDGDYEAARGLAKAGAAASLAGSVGMNRDTRIEKLIADVTSALKVPTGAPNFDDHVGTKELRLNVKDLVLPASKAHRRALLFYGDGGTYRAVFEFVKG